MKRSSRSLQALKSSLWSRAQKDPDKDKRDDYRMLHDFAQDTEREYNKMFGEIEMQMLRNPAFPDDMVGYPDEDVKLFDEIEEEKKTDKDNEDNQP